MAEVRVDGSLPYYRIYADADRESHLEVCDLPMSLREFAPPAPPLLVTAPKSGNGIMFITFPPRRDGDWHPVPRRQWMIALSAGLEADLSDGTIVRVPSSAIYLMEDTHGRGHRSRYYLQRSIARNLCYQTQLGLI